VSATFQVGGADTDPTTITVLHRNPSGTLTTWVYGTDAEVVKNATGQYHADIDIDEAGRWWYRWVGTGTAQAAEESSFLIDTTETA
jgi:hypothetical protein